MDIEIVDDDVLGLTIIFEVESLCSRREIELYPKGKDIIVESKNMKYSVKPWSVLLYILIKMTKEEKYLELNLQDIHLADKQEEAMLMSNLDRDPVTDQCGSERDND
ncbi:hypothetical protein H5410_004909 [Solanum commersonii]|uniref:Uncharacterized protein n=1 Tax=Solanum commersonii TaxID=4109 RepID=A0A9J6A5X0_SOLCO|nr:hypothetical protein H5410_004909 [Solanum commersonii]